MSQRLFLTRHAEAEHNATGDYTIRDPALTELGRRQATSIAATNARALEDCDLIVTSPLRRTIETTLLGFYGADASPRRRRVPIVLMPELQEAGAHACDVGSPADELRKLFADDLDVLDFRPCGDGWFDKTGSNAPTADALAARALFVRRWLRDRPERNIIVVSHYGFLCQMIGRTMPDTSRFVPPPWVVKLYHFYERVVGRNGWSNAEIRLHRFAAGQDDETAKLEYYPVEIDEPVSATDGNAAPQQK